MKFDLRKPCEECPFRKDGSKPVRLRNAARVHEVWQSTTWNGRPFSCHKTVDRSDDGLDDGPDDDHDRRPGKDEQHCMGAILAGIASGEGPNQLVRIASRLGSFPAEAINDDNLALVFDCEEDMAASADESRKRKRA